MVNFPDPDPAKRSGSDRIRIRNTGGEGRCCCFKASTGSLERQVSLGGGELEMEVSLTIRVDNDNHFASFFAKKGLQTIIVFREKMM